MGWIGRRTTSRSFWNAIKSGDRPSSSSKTFHHPPLTKEDLEKTVYYFISAKVELGRNVTTPISVEYLQRNFYIAARADDVYAFGFLEGNNTQMNGGTGWTVEFVNQLGRPIFAIHLINKHWYKYNTHTKTFYRMGGGNFIVQEECDRGCSCSRWMPRLENGPCRSFRTDPCLPRTPNPHGGTLRWPQQITLPQELWFFFAHKYK